jgi:hypothetical protein
MNAGDLSTKPRVVIGLTRVPAGRSGLALGSAGDFLSVSHLIKIIVLLVFSTSRAAAKNSPVHLTLPLEILNVKIQIIS